MSGRLGTAMLAAGALCCLLSSVRAEALMCGPRDQVTKVLAEKYKEFPRAAGIMSGLTLMEIYVSERGTWTILTTNDQGIACVVRAGEAWDELPPPPKGRPS